MTKKSRPKKRAAARRGKAPTKTRRIQVPRRAHAPPRRRRAVELVDVLAGLSSVDVKRRIDSIDIIGELYDPWNKEPGIHQRIRKEAVPKLIPMLSDTQNPAIRRAAARALGRIGARSAMRGLIRLLNDPVPEVKSAAAEALGNIGDLHAVRPLAELFRKLKEAEVQMYYRIDETTIPRVYRNAGVRKAVAAALGDIGGQEAVKVLASALTGPEHDPNPEVRAAVIAALVSMSGKPEAPLAEAYRFDIAIVLKALQNASYDQAVYVRDAARQGLLKIKE